MRVLADVRGVSAEVIRWQDGDNTKKDPFFILVLNNVALERPTRSNNFTEDPIYKDRKGFTACAEYIFDNLFGLVPGQAEGLLADSPNAQKIRFWSAFIYGLVPGAATSMVGENPTRGSLMIEPRRDAVPAMLKYAGYDPDMVFLVSGSPTHKRASAYGATDDDARGGVPATYDGRQIVHRYYHRIPGMAAIHRTAKAMTPAHEFGHAFSSYSNGFITDLYVDGIAAFNVKTGRPIPKDFAPYNGKTFKSDLARDGLGYPSNWRSYHSELDDAARPALMDNYWYSTGGPLTSKHDRLTKAYVLDRVAAKVAR